MESESPSVREAVLRRARRIELSSRRLVARALAGDARSVFRGSGIEFDSVREYSYGDDVRAIDWNVTARAGRPFVKQFVTTRERDVVLAIDRSASMELGTESRTKAEVVAEFAAVLALVATRGRERVGLVEYGIEDPKQIAPRRRVATLDRLITRLLAPVSTRAESTLTEMVDRADRVLKRRALVFLISDFHEVPAERDLSRLDFRHEVIVVRVVDPREQELAGKGVVRCVDPETGHRFTIDPGSPRERAAFVAASRARTERLRGVFARAGVRGFELNTRDTGFAAFFEFLESHRHGANR